MLCVVLVLVNDWIMDDWFVMWIVDGGMLMCGVVIEVVFGDCMLICIVIVCNMCDWVDLFDGYCDWFKFVGGFGVLFVLLFGYWLICMVFVLLCEIVDNIGWIMVDKFDMWFDVLCVLFELCVLVDV